MDREGCLPAMKLYPVQILRVGDKKYSVLIETVSPSGRHEFDFEVSQGPIRAVESTDEFEAFIGHNISQIKCLFEAILAFDESQGSELVI